MYKVPSYSGKQAGEIKRKIRQFEYEEFENKELLRTLKEADRKDMYLRIFAIISKTSEITVNILKSIGI